MTTKNLVLFITSILTLENIMKNFSVNLLITAKSLNPTPFLLGDIENVLNSKYSYLLNK